MRSRSDPTFAAVLLLLTAFVQASSSGHPGQKPAKAVPADVQFNIRSVRSGNWSDPRTWEPKRLPAAGDRVLIRPGTRVVYDVADSPVLRLVQLAGTLSFARDRNTTLNVAIVSIRDSEVCSESGFDCDFHDDSDTSKKPGDGAALEVGTSEQPIPAQFSACIRLHYIAGMNKDDAPAVICCGGRLDLHGAPLSRTWVDLGKTAKPGDDHVLLSEPVEGWRPGDDVILTGSKRKDKYRFRNKPEHVTTEERRITRIDGRTIYLNAPLKEEHLGDGEFRSEIANLSRNVVIESADPKGIRGHTMYHRHSTGSISYARFAHLGKEGVLGRYAIHFHLCGTTMRGSYVLGAAIVDSHNRWVTIHGTQFLLVRDCVGYQSVGHGYFLEDGTEVYNILDRNLGVQAYRGKPLPKQMLPFDPNDGAAFWWANGRNTLVRNVSCENEEYGFRYDCQHSRYFNSTLPILMPDGSKKPVDVRTLAFFRFEDNEAHTEGLYGMVVANNGNSQPDDGVTNLKMLKQIQDIDWTGPDARHPHIIKNLKLWNVHYALRPHTPNMIMDNVRIHNGVYGIYRPAFDNHVYKDLYMYNVVSEPFNRGMDDASVQQGKITVDGLTFAKIGYGPSSPLVQISDNNLSGTAETHIRRLVVERGDKRKPAFDRGVGLRVDPVTAKGVPIYVHDYYGPGRHAKIASIKARDLLNDGNQYRKDPPFTGDEAVVAEVKDIDFPKLLDPVDDLPPATMILSMRRNKDGLLVRGISHDNGEITAVIVNGQKAKMVLVNAGVVDWEIRLNVPADGVINAHATDRAGNVEQLPHRVQVPTQN
jgi:hypothetical protein